MTSFRLPALASDLSGWIETLDSRPREKQVAAGAAIIAALCVWFGVALGAPLLALGVPALGAVFFAAVKTQRRLRTTERPIEPGENLLSRISLATSPPPVGRMSAAYVCESQSERVYEPLVYEEPPVVEAEEVGERVYEVCQVVDGRRLVRHTSTSLFGATDFALELQERSHGAEIELLRTRGETREAVLRLGRAAQASEAATSLLGLFAYPRTCWRGPA